MSVMPTWTVERNCAGCLREVERHLRAVIAFFGALLQPDLARRDDGNLGHREDAVGEHEQDDDDDLEPDAAHVSLHCTGGRPESTRSPDRSVDGSPRTAGRARDAVRRVPTTRRHRADRHPAPYTRDVMLSLDNVRKRYGATVAVDGLSLDRAREARCSGCSARTAPARARRSISPVGLLAPDGGRVAIDGAAIRAIRPSRTRLGVAPQALALYDVLTGEENLRFFGEVYGLSGTRAPRARALEPRVRRPDRSRGRPRRRLLRRHEAAAQPGVGARARSRTDPARRADGRRRSAVAQPDLREHPGAQAAGADADLHDALHGRGRAAVRPRRDHRQGPAPGARHGAGAAGRARRAADRWSRRPTAASGASKPPIRSASSIASRPPARSVPFTWSGRRSSRCFCT